MSKEYYNATAPRPRSANQDVGTPDDFLDVIRSEFNLVFDLAADLSNAVTLEFFSEEDDSLIQSWYTIASKPDEWLWLNPPFHRINPWAAKCAEEMENGANILLLVPASVGSVWYRKYVEPVAVTRFCMPRLKFKGHEQSYPKDIMLCVFKKGLKEKMLKSGKSPTYTWKWK